MEQTDVTCSTPLCWALLQTQHDALSTWTDWRDAHTGRGFEEAFAMDEQVVSPPQTIDAEQLTALRALLASP